jgi:uncharacterized protein
MNPSESSRFSSFFPFSSKSLINATSRQKGNVMDPNSGSVFSNFPDQEQTKFVIENDQEELETPKELPESYGDNRVIIMARDPLWFFAYWDATPDRLDAQRREVGDEMWQRGQAVLRVYDVTGIEDPARAHNVFDVNVTFSARRWYVNVPMSGRTYFVDLGFKFPDGRFLPLLHSNRISMPVGKISNQTDSQWMIVNMEQWQEMFEKGTLGDPASRSSAEMAKMMAQRWEFLRSVFSGSSSKLSSSAWQKEEPKN